MKKNLQTVNKLGILLFILLNMTAANAQVANSANYSYSTATSGSLTADMNGNPIDLSTRPDLQSPGLSATMATKDIGFDFFFMGTRYTHFTPTVRGTMTLGWLVPGTATISFTNAYTAPVLAPFWTIAGFTPGQGRNIRSRVVGTAPNRCMVFEWRTFSGGGTGGSSPTFIYQTRLYETTGVVEYVYGQMDIAPNYLGAPVQAAIGWVNNSTTPTNNILSSVTSLSSYTATTSLATANVAVVNHGTSGPIPGLSPGRLFRWTPNVASAPTSLVFSGVTNTNTTLSWTDNSSNEFGFAIYRSDDGGTTYNYITQTAANVNTFTQNGLQPGINYLYRVFAITEGGLSTALSGSQATTGAGAIVSTASGNWSSPATWAGGVVPKATDNVTIANGHTVIIDIGNAFCNNLTVGQGISGILRYSATAPGSLFAYGNVTVAAGATFDVAPSNIQTHALTIGGLPTTGSAGSLTVTGTFDMNNVTTPTAGSGAVVTFGGFANGSISGAGTIDFFSITVNKGNFPIPAQNPILDVTTSFTINTPVASANRLNINSGSFRISAANTITPYFGSTTICNTGGGLWLNHSGANVSCFGSSTAIGAGAPTFFGELRMDNGTFAYGSGNNQWNFTTSSLGGVTYGAKLTMNGGTLNVWGGLNMTSSSSISFDMSGGNINIDPQAANFLGATGASFSIGGATSVNWSSGTVTIVDPNFGATSTANVSLVPGGTKNITGGTLRIGDGVSSSGSGAFTNQNGFLLSLSMGVWNLVIDNRTDLNNTRQARIGAPVTYTGSYVLNDLTIQNNATLMLSSGGTAQILGIYGNLINNGALEGPEAGSTSVFGSTSVLGTLQFVRTSGTQTMSGTGSFYNIATLSVQSRSPNLNSTNNVIFNQTNNLVVNTVNMVTGTLTHNSKLVVGRVGQIPAITLGGNGIASPSGSFATIPSVDNSSFNLQLTYNTTNAPFTMGANNEISPTSTILHSLSINNPQGITINRNLNIVSTLTLSAGDVFIGNNNMTLGTGVSYIGILNHSSGTSGQIICGPTGTFTRWVNTTAAPTIANSASLFPLGTPGSRRLAYVYFSASNALASAGTVTARHIDSSGVTSMSSYTENTFTMDTRSRAGWAFSTGNGFGLTGTISVQLHGEGAVMIAPDKLSDQSITMTDNSGAVFGGTYVLSGGSYTNPNITRTGLSAANLTSSPLYFGSPSSNMGGVITAINTGDWNTNSTWNTNTVPTATDNVIIADNVTVTCAGGSGTYNCNNLLLVGNASTLTMNNAANTLNVGGQFIMQGKAATYAGQSFLNLSAGTINVTGWDTLIGGTTGLGVSITNGNVTMSGGTLNLSNSNKCNRNFLFTSGLVDFSGGNINIFGKLQASGIFYQKAGNITIDPLGPGGGAPNNSCTGTTNTESAFYMNNASSVFSGGNIIIVDPPYNSSVSGGAQSVYIATNGYTRFTESHTIQLGDGVSTQVGLVPANGFPVETYAGGRVPLNNLVINGGSTVGRHGNTSTQNSTIYGTQTKSMIINSGSEFIHSSSFNNDFMIGSSLVNNGTLTQSATTPLILGFGNLGLSVFPGDVTVSGTGTFRNRAVSPNASFTNLQVHMGNATLKAILGVNNLRVRGTLTMTTGNLDIGTNNFTLGVSSPDTAGTLTWSNGFILNSPGGTFTRVFPTTGLPTTSGNGNLGHFPMGRFNPVTFLTENRSLNVFFSTTTALSTGGTISVGHTHLAGYTSITPFTDNAGALSISQRSNSSWSVTNSGLALSGTISLAATGTNVNITPSVIGNTTLCEAAAAAGGTYLAGLGTQTVPIFQRSGMSVTNITSKTFYGGIASANNLGGAFVAVANGNWDQGSTWNTGTVPTSADAAEIPAPYTVILGSGAAHNCKSLNINSGGSLIANANTLTVAERIINAGTITLGNANFIINDADTPTFGLVNSGTFLMNGGTMRLGPVGGGAATLSNTNAFTMNDGTINLNGNFAQTAGTFTMSAIGAPTLIVDGNDGTTAIRNVASTTDLFSITGGSTAVTGGIVTIVDPPFGAGSNRALQVTAGAIWTNNVLNIGDGTSTTTSGTVVSAVNRTGFRLNTSSLNIGNVVIKGGNIATRWASVGGSETFTCTNLSVESGSEFRTIVGTLTISGGNLTNAGTLSITTNSVLSFSGTIPQSFTNTGVFRSDTLGNVANLNQISSLSISNSSSSGVDVQSLGNFSIGIATSFSGNLTLSGILNIGANTLTLGTGTATIGALLSSTGAIICSSGGGFQRWFPTSPNTTAVPADVNRFPLGILVNGTLMRRDIWITPSLAAITSGGTMRVTHTNSPGLSSVTSFNETGGPQGVNTRTNSFWTVTTANGYNNGSATFSARVQGSGLVNPLILNNITIMGQTGVLGGSWISPTNSNLDPQANRSTMSLANLTSSPGLYIGGQDTNLFPLIQSVTSGNWNTASTWSTNTVPTATDNVLINSNHSITLDANGATRDLTMNSGSILTANANTLTINRNYTNSSANLSIGGGTVTILGSGPANGLISSGTIVLNSGNLNVGQGANFNRTFNASSGTLIINGGQLNVQGNVVLGVSPFTMSGGTMKIDGNDGSTAIGSVASGTSLLQFNTTTQNVTGGTIQIVDPPFTGTAAALNYFTSTAVIWTGNTLELGDGVSTNPGSTSTFSVGGVANTLGFNLITSTASTAGMRLFNVNVNGGSGGSNRFVSGPPSNAQSLSIGNNLTITSGSELRTLYGTSGGGGNINVGGNITNNGTLVTGPFTTLALRRDGTNASTDPQIIGGSGVYTNLIGGSGTSFSNLLLNNTNTNGVDMSGIGNITINDVNGTTPLLTLTSGILKLGNNNITIGSSVTKPGSVLVGIYASLNNPSNGMMGTINTRGSMTRWFSTSAITMPSPNTSNVNNQGVFPLSVLSSPLSFNRSLALSNSTTLTSGGTVTVTHIDSSGITTGFTPFSDNAVNVNSRFNFRWTISTGNGFATSGTPLNYQVSASGIQAGAVTNLANLRMMNASTIGSGTAGTNLGTFFDPVVVRTGLDATSFGSTVFVGGPGLLSPIPNNHISAAQSVGIGVTPNPFTGSLPTGGAGSYTYQWQSSVTNSSSGFSNIGGATGQNYSIPAALTQTTWYRRVVVSGSSSDSSLAIQVEFTGPQVTVMDTLVPFTKCAGQASAAQSFRVKGSNLGSNNINITPPAGFEISLSAGSGYASSLSLVPSSGIVSTTTIFVRMTSASTGSPSGNITCASAGATTRNVAAAGSLSSVTAVTVQPATTQSVCLNATPSNLTLTAAGGALTYQWYSNATNSRSGGTLIGSATATSYTPPTTSAATTYYYCVVTGTCGLDTSTTSAVIVNPSTIIGTEPAATQTVCQNTTPTNISVVASGTGTLTYQWYNNTSNSNSGGTIIGSATAASYTPPTTSAATTYYYCVVTGSCGLDTSTTSAVIVNPSTVIGTEPAATQTVCQNTTPTNISVVASGTGTLTYQWYSNTSNSRTGGILIGSATADSYTPITTSAATTYYYCVVTGNCGLDTSTTSAVIVNPTTIIGTEPATTQTVCQNATPTNISLVSGGVSLTYQWYSNTSNSNSGGTLIGSATAASYTPPTTSAATTYYYCVVTGSCGLDTSTTSAVIVNPSTVIGTEPAATQTVCQNTTPTNISVVASGTGTLTYQWYSNTSNSNSGGTIIGSATADSYTPITTTAATTYYYCVVTGNCGLDTSTTSAVIVNPTTMIGTEPAATQTVCQNASPTNISVAATGTGTLTYQWYSNATNSRTGGTLIGSATAASYTPPTTTAATTYYYCVVTGSCGLDTSTTSAVIVNPSTIIGTEPATTQNECQTVTSTNLVVVASGTGTLTYQWYSNASNSNSGGTSLGASATAASYGPSTASTGTVYYYCVVTGSCGLDTSSTSAVTVNSLPTITLGSSPAVCQGVTSANLPYSATTFSPNQYSIDYNAAANTAGFVDVTNATLTSTPIVLTLPPGAAAATYNASLTVRNSTTGCVSSSTAFTITLNPTTTTVTGHPLTTQTVCQNTASTKIGASATGGTSMSYQWYRNTVNNNTTGTIISGATSDSFIPPTDTAGTRYYYCLTTGSCGAASTNTSTVIVNPTTIISTEPATTQTVCQNATPTAISLVSGGVSLTYQWYSNATNSRTGGTLIGSATSASYTPLTSTAATTYYYCVVTGTCGLDTSITSAVIVNPTTIIGTEPATTQTVCQNTTPANISVISGGVSLSYQWYSNATNSRTGGTLIGSATSASYTPPTSTAATTYYYCVVTGTCGLDTSITSAVIVNPTTIISTEPGTTQTVCQNATPANISLVSGGVSLTYQWYSNATNSRSGGTSIGSANAASYTPLTSTAATTYYYCVVTGTCGLDTSITSAVIVNPTTIIGTEPATTQTVCQNTTPANISVISGGVSLTYQWYSNATNSRTGGTLIGSATSASYTPPTTSAATTFYYCVVTGTCGLDTSTTSRVIVNPTTVVSTEPATTQTVCQNATPTAISLVSGGVSLTYQWYSNATNSRSGGTSIGSANAASYTPPTSTATTTYYYCVVTGTCGLDTSITSAVIVNPTTIISTEPAATQTVCQNASPTTISLVSGGASLAYQWYSNATNSKTGGSLIGGANSASYVPPTVTVGTTFYYCVVTGTCGLDTSNTSAVIVTPSTLITTQPAVTQTFCINSTATKIRVVAIGTGTRTYQWYSNTANNNTTGTIISSATLDSFAPPTTAAGTLYYYCVVNSSCGSAANSNTSTVIVTPNSTITTQPSSTPQTVCQNSAPTNITVVAAGTGPFTYQWFSNTTNNNSGGTSLGASATTAAFAPPTTAAGTLYYYCTISGSCGAPVTSNTSTVIVTPITSITTQPAMAQTVCQNVTATRIKVVANGTGTLTYQWFSNATNANTGGTSLGAAATADSLIPSTAATGTLYYYCIVGSNCGPPVTSNTSSVTVTPATAIATQPLTTQTVCLNATPTNLSIVASGTGTVTYQWYSNTVNNNTSGALISSATNPNYTPSTATAATTYYYCIVNSSCGPLTSTTSTVLVNPPVSITTQPLPNTFVCQNSTFNASVTALNTSGYQWQRNGINVTIGTGDTTANYSIANAQPSNAGVFRVLVKGLTSCPDVFSTNDTLRMTTLAAITTVPSTFQVCEDQAISITGSATNAASYQWLLNGSPIAAPNGTAQTYTKGASLAAMSDSGMYRLVALSNNAGAATCKADTSAAVLGAVVRKIQITTQPLAKTFVCQNSAFNATITAQNVTAYQWRKNGTNVTAGSGGTTASYSITSTQPADAGIFTVQLTGNSPCPSVTSTNDTLQVTTLASLTGLPIGFQVCEDQSINITGNASNAASYQWLFNGNPISAPNGTAQTYNKGTSPAAMADSGFYRLVALSNNAGAATCKADTSPAVLGAVMRKIQITTQPMSMTRVCQNSPFNASITAQNVIAYQWRRNGANVTTGNGATTANYGITLTQPSNAGVYTVVMTGNSPCPSVTSSNDTLQVTPLAAISSPLSPFQICEDQAINIAGAANNAASYQWLFNGNPISAPNGTAQNYTKGGSLSAMSDSGRYRLVALSANAGATICKADTSAEVVGSVFRKIVITTQPASIARVCQNSVFNASIAVQNVTGFQWRRNGTNVTLGTGANTANYSIASAQPTDAGIYTVQLTGNTSCPSVTSSNDTLLVTTLALITTTPSPFQVCEDQSISITGAASNAASYRWLFNGNPIAAPNGIAQTYNKGGSPAAMSDSGMYRLVALSANAGSTVCKADTSAAVLGAVVRKIIINTQPPVNSIGCVTANFSMTIAAQNVTAYSWRLNGNVIGQTTATMSRIPFAIADTGIYTVVMTGNTPCPSVTSNNARVNGILPAVIVTEPTGKDLCLGDSLMLSVTSNTTQFYQWRKNGVNIGGTTTSNTFKIPSVTYTDSATYSVIAYAFNNCVNDTSVPAIVKVRMPLSITTPLANTDEKCEGQNISYTIGVAGSGPYAYAWSLNGNPIGTNSTNYSKNGIALSDSGRYIVQIQGAAACPSIRDTIQLAVRKSLSIIAPLANTDVKCEGQTINYQIGVSGSGPYSYIWRLNGGTVGSNSSSYTKNGILVADSGRYTVQIQGSAVCPSIFDTLDLDVNKAPIIVTQPSGVSPVCLGSNIVLSASASNQTALEWHKQGLGYLGQTGTSYTSSGSLAASSGNYFVIAKGQPACADVASNSFNVKVNDPVRIVSQPSGAELVESPPGTHTMSVVVLGTGPFNYQWFKNGVIVPLANSSSYTILNYVEALDSGNYYVEIKAPAPCNNTEVSSIAKVTTVKCPKLLGDTIRMVNICAGRPFSLDAAATGAKSYQWFKNNVAITGGDKPNFSIPLATASDAGVYRCRVFALNTTKCTSIITDSIVVTVKDKPMITKHPEGIKLCAVSTHTMKVVATFGETFQWYRNGIAISPDGDKDSFVYNNVNTIGDAFYVEVGNNLCPSAKSNSITIKSVVPGNQVFLANNSEFDLIERCSDANGWTYYATTAQTERLLMAIKKNGNMITAKPDLELMNGIREISSINAENKGAILGGRIFNLDITGSIVNPYELKFYYNKAEGDAVLARLNDIKLANPGQFSTDKVDLSFILTTQQAFTSSLWSNLTIPLNIPHTVSFKDKEFGVENGVNFVILKQLVSPKLGGTIYMDYKLKTSSGITQVDKNGFGFSLYPVPTTDGKVTVDVSSKKLKPITFTVTDMTGRTVAVFNEKHTSLESSHAFDFSQLANGNYQLILSNDEESAIGRFTISK